MFWEFPIIFTFWQNYQLEGVFFLNATEVKQLCNSRAIILVASPGVQSDEKVADSGLKKQ